MFCLKQLPGEDVPRNDVPAGGESGGGKTGHPSDTQGCQLSSPPQAV